MDSALIPTPAHFVELAWCFPQSGDLLVGGWALRTGRELEFRARDGAALKAHFVWYERADVRAAHPGAPEEAGFFALVELPPGTPATAVVMTFRSDDGTLAEGTALNARDVLHEDTDRLRAILAQHRVLLGPEQLERQPRPLELLRAASTPFSAANGPVALFVDHVVSVPDGAVAVAGWCHADEGFSRLELIDAAGTPRADVLRDAVFYQRPDVDAHLAGRPRLNDEAGFVLRVAPFADGRGPLTVLGVTTTGDLFTGALGIPPTDTHEEVLRRLLALVPASTAREAELCRRHLCPCLLAVKQNTRPRAKSTELVRSHSFGSAPESPSLSVVIPLGPHPDWLRHQLRQLGDDDDFRDADVCFVVPAAGGAAAQRSAEELAPHFGVPFRLFTSLDASGASRQALVNAVVPACRGRHLLLLDGMVLARGRGWLSGLAIAYRERAAAGGVGPKLVNATGGIVQGPTTRIRSRFDPAWEVESCEVRGLPESLLELAECVRVPALSTACLFTERELFLEAGGLSKDYWHDRYVDHDFSRRVAGAGRELYFVPSVTLDDLAPSEPPAPDGVRARLEHCDQWRLHATPAPGTARADTR